VESFAEAIKDVGKTIKSEFSSAFLSVINGTKSVGEAFRGMILKIITSLADRAISSAFDDLFSKMAKASGTSGGFADLFSKGVSYLGGLFGGGTTSEVPGLADGGYASATKPHLIGERGPELFIPSASGRVVSNSDLGGMGGQVNQTFNITTGVQQTVRAEIQSLMPQIAAASTKAVLDARRRGGSFAGAFA
jgi:phage-related minor tail protein